MATMETIRYRFPGLHIYEGTVMTKIFTASRIDRVRNMEFDGTDVIVATYPKSGTTWVQEVAWLLLNGCDFEGAKSSLLEDRCPFLEYDLPDVDPTSSNRDQTRTAPRCLKTHLKEEVLHSALEKGRPKVIIVLRNPKDVLVSQYHFYRMNKGLGCFTGTWDEFFEMFKNKELQFGYWYDHVLGWWACRHSNPNFHYVKYEDMKNNALDTLRSLVDFLGVSVTEDQAQKVLSHTHVDKMKSNKMVNRENSALFDMSTSKFIRKGIVGDWKNYFSKEQSDFVDGLCADLAERGLTFEFE